MGKTYLVARREFVENARTKGFWISIVLGPLLMLGSIGLMVFLQTQKDVRKFAIEDKTGWLAEAIEADFLAPDLGKIFAAYAVPDADPEESEEIEKKVPEKKTTREKTTGETRERPAFLETQTWKQIALVMDEASDEQKAQLGMLASGLLRPELEQIGRDFPLDKLPSLAKGMLDQSGLGEGDLKQAWRDFWAYRDWWLGLSKKERRGLTRKGWDPRFELVHFDADAEDDKDKKSGEELLKAKLESDDIYAYFVLEDVPLDQVRIGSYHSNNVTDNALRRWYSGRATEVLRRKRIDKLGIGEDGARQILMRASFTEKTVDAAGVEKTVDISDKAAKVAPFVFVLILWMSILMISQMLLTNTIEEKSNRIIEVLLSSVSPLQLMAGKILGLAWTGIAILGFYAFFALVVINLAPAILPQSAEMLLKLNLEAILANPRYMGSFFLYFVTGYVFFASLLVAIGSVSNSLKDAQNLAQPVMILLMVPYIASFTLISDPNGTIARILSYIPPFTPFIMMVRAGGPPPMIDYVLTTILLVITTVACFYGAAKIFRVGVLMTGKPPKVMEILRWLRAPVGQVPQTKD